MQQIPTLSPIIFKKEHIKNNKDELLNDDNIAQFFIHSFKDDNVYLNLPLPPHRKTVNDFVFITNGEMIKNIGIEPFHLKKNDFLFTPKNDITTTKYVSDNLEGFYCHFSDDFIGTSPFLAALHTQPSDQNFLHLPESEVAHLEFLLTHITKLYKNRKKNVSNYRLLPFYLSTIIAEFFFTFKKEIVRPIHSSNIFPSFKNLVEKQFKQNISIKKYASQLNITPNHLNKRVKYETGKTASEIIKETMVLEAKVLLLQTRMTIKEISIELGFDDASYFSRFFKSETDFTPSAYRATIDLS